MTVDPSKHYSITSAPRVAKGKVLIGNSGGEFGVRGYVSAYDAQTGKLAWRFHTVPGNPADGFESEAMKKAAATWGGEWWKLGGGGTVWDAIVYDPTTDLVYFGTGNGTPWNQRMRDPTGGDNLYLASIVAVKADTGEYVWHYQSTPGDTWDYDAVSPMMTVNLSLDGKERHVLLQPCKNGFFYVLDAATGELLKADPFTEVNWADGVDMKTGRPRVRKEARYSEGKPFNLAPGVQGAHGWQANAFSPETGLVYVPTQEAYFPMVEDPNYKPSAVGYNLGLDFGAQTTFYRANPKAKSGFTGYLQAWDPVTGKQVWKGEPNERGSGGALATAGGLVFHGGGSSGEFRAYDAKTGEKLWSVNAQTGVIAGPITYELDGKQYVAASVGASAFGGDYYAPNYSRMLVFTLGGTAQLPPVKPYTPRPLDPPPATAAADVVQAGQGKYSQYCAACHGENGQTRGANFPDLTRTPMLHSQEGFDAVVLNGVLSAKGMASFAKVLKPEDTQALRAFSDRARDRAQEEPAVRRAAPQATQHEEKGSRARFDLEVADSWAARAQPVRPLSLVAPNRDGLPGAGEADASRTPRPGSLSRTRALSPRTAESVRCGRRRARLPCARDRRRRNARSTCREANAESEASQARRNSGMRSNRPRGPPDNSRMSSTRGPEILLRAWPRVRSRRSAE
jgi:PQQ-dependent dehydrogenase (methanol/ethanol family)